MTVSHLNSKIYFLAKSEAKIMNNKNVSERHFEKGLLCRNQYNFWSLEQCLAHNHVFRHLCHEN